MARSQRDEAKAQLWRDRFTQHQQSGLSVREFCRLHQLSEKQFYVWRRNLLGSRRPPPKPATLKPVAFVPIRLTTEPVVEITLPSGLGLKLPLATDPALVTRLLAAVQAC